MIFSTTKGFENLQPYERYLAMQSIGVDKLVEAEKIIARNLIYLCSESGMTVRQLQYAIDLFRGQLKPSLWAVRNLCIACNVDADVVLKRDLLSELMTSDKKPLLKFSPGTYRIASDTW